MSFAHGGIETTSAPRDPTNPARAARPAAPCVAGLSRPGASGRLRAMSDLHDEFLGRWDDVDPLDGPPSPARDLVLAAQFEDELQNGGLAQFLWNFFPRWEKVLDGAERAYRAMGAEKQVSALAGVRALLRENAPACAPLVERAKGEKEPGRAFGEWYAGAEERMSLPSEDLFLPDDPGLAAKRLAYVEAHRDELFGASPPARRRLKPVSRKRLECFAFLVLVLIVFAERTMLLLYLASLLAIAGLAIAFVAVLLVRLFTKRRPPLCTRRAAAVAAAAVFVVVLGQAGLLADTRRYTALVETAKELDGADAATVESRLGPPENRFSVESAPRHLSFPLGDKAKSRAAEIWTYRAGVWYSPYQPSTRLVVCFDGSGVFFHWSVDD